MPSEMGGQASGCGHRTVAPRRQRAAYALASDGGMPPAATNTEIEGHSSADHRQKNALSGARARSMAPTGNVVPAAAKDDEFGGQATGDDHPATAPSGERATEAMDTISQVPAAVTDKIGGLRRLDDQKRCAPSSERAEPILTTDRSLPAAANIAALSELQRQRRFCIKSQSRTDRACEAFIARYLGYTPDMPKPEGAAIWKQAAALRRAVEKGGRGQARSDGLDGGVLSACSPIILHSAAAREAWDNHRNQTEKQMRKLAAALPVHAWAKSIAGFGDLGLAIIIGETGDLSNYATKERVWKRLGLAVINGERQQRKSGAEAAAAHGYNPARRAEIWTISDSMFRHQWASAKDDAPAAPKGPYGTVYAARKAHTVNRDGWTLGHRENDARRVMMKFFLENLYRVWNDKRPLKPSEVATPRADLEQPLQVVPE